jgi:chemotaxis protein methyltransferase CheR
MMEQAWPQPVLQALAASIRDRAGLSFVPARYDELERRTRRAMAKAGITDVHDYTDGLGSGRLSFDDWVAELTVGETYFFREPLQFEFLRRQALPVLTALRGPGHVFRVWSAGCASGEEAYSLAILFEEEGLSANLRLVGTDLSRAALAKARQARYGAWALRGSRDAWIDRYFRRHPGKKFELVERIRQQVIFDYLNLALDGYPSFFTGIWGNDVILCRNVMIYWDRDTVKDVARRLFETLADGGWLITGPSDPPLNDYAPYETVLTDAGVFYRRSQHRAPVRGPTRATHQDGRASRFPPADEETTETTGVRSIWIAEAPAAPGSVELERPRSASGDPVEATAGKGAADPWALAQAAFAAGLYDRAIEHARTVVDHGGAAALEVRATANLLGAREASRLCTDALLRFPLGTELYVLQASLLLDLRDYDAATLAARRLLYLDRSLVVAHLLLGSILGKRGEREEALRAFRNARDLARSAPSDDVVPFADGDKAGRLADFARAQMQLLGAEPVGEGEGAS